LILLVGYLGLLTCKNRLPYNLYCIGGDVKHCTIQSDAVGAATEKARLQVCGSLIL